MEVVDNKTQTEVIFETPTRDCEGDGLLNIPESSGGSTTTLETDYEIDPDCPEGVIAQSQPCWKHGVRYTPLGLRRVYHKKRKLEFDDDSAAGDKRKKKQKTLNNKH